MLYPKLVVLLLASFSKEFSEATGQCGLVNRTEHGLEKVCGYEFTAQYDYKHHFTSASRAVPTLIRLLKNCSATVNTMICSLFVPRCEEDIPGPYLPCRAVCYDYATRCRDVIAEKGLQWTVAMCDILPERDDPNTKLGYRGRCFTPPNFKDSGKTIVVVLSSSVQVNRATTITVSPSSMVSSSSVLQRDFTTMPSWSVVRTSTSSFQSTSVVYSSPRTFPSSPASSMTNSVVKSKFTKTVTTSVSCVTLTSSIPVTQYKHTTVHVTPTKVVITRIRGILSMTIITVIASVLGVILLLLLAIIIWDLCIVHVLPWRPTSRVEPRGDVSHVRSDMV